MSSQAQEVSGVITSLKEYDVFLGINNATPSAIEYTSLTLPGRAAATSYSLATNLRTLTDSAGDGEFNNFTVQVPMSIAQWKNLHENYGKTAVVKIASTISSNLSCQLSGRISEVSDWSGAFDAINPIDISIKTTNIE